MLPTGQWPQPHSPESPLQPAVVEGTVDVGHMMKVVSWPTPGDCWHDFGQLLIYGYLLFESTLWLSLPYIPHSDILKFKLNEKLGLLPQIWKEETERTESCDNG